MEEWDDIFIYADGIINWYNFSGGHFGNREYVIPLDL